MQKEKLMLVPFNDVYFIGEQVKKFCSDYELLYSKAKKQYVVFDNKNSEIVLLIPSYPTSEVLYKLHKTRREKFSAIFKEIEENNAKIALKNEQNAISLAEDKLSEVFKFANLSPYKNLKSDQIKKIISEEI